MPQLSVIILSYNTKLVTKDSLGALARSVAKQEVTAEAIVVDNDSQDGSVEMLQSYEKSQLPSNFSVRLILNKENAGYPKGNNQGIEVAKGKYILLLNSDAIIKEIDFQELFDYLDKNPQVGALTARLMLTTGTIDPASHRGFPTLWNSFCYFAGLEKVFGKVPLLNQLFGGYHLTYKNLSKIHEIDSPTGAFYLSPAEVFKKVGGFDDKNFFLYGEDLDLSFRIKEKGYKIIYYPKFEILHLKGSSGIKKTGKVQSKSKDYFYQSMKIFYRKHYAQRHPQFVNNIVYSAIDLKKKLS